MRITRRQLRRLIAEAYKTGIPYRSPIDQSDTMIARHYPQFTDKIASVDPRQKEAFKLALDLNRPTPDVTLRAIDNCANGLCQDQIYELVEKYFKENTVYSSGSSLEIAEYIFKKQMRELSRGAIDALYPQKNGIPMPDDVAIEEVIRRYAKAVDRPHHRQLGHIIT